MLKKAISRMVADTVPPPPFETVRTMIVHKEEMFWLEKIIHRKGDIERVWFDLVVAPGAPVSIRNLVMKDAPYAE